MHCGDLLVYHYWRNNVIKFSSLTSFSPSCNIALTPSGNFINLQEVVTFWWAKVKGQHHSDFINSCLVNMISLALLEEMEENELIRFLRSQVKGQDHHNDDELTIVKVHFTGHYSMLWLTSRRREMTTFAAVWLVGGVPIQLVWPCWQHFCPPCTGEPFYAVQLLWATLSLPRGFWITAEDKACILVLFIKIVSTGETPNNSTNTALWGF